jgi:enediyne polyketide synthase
MAVLEGWRFDPLEFGIPPVTFNASDMAHWLALYTARAAIRDAGLNLQAIDRTRIGVVLGNTLTGEFARSHYLRHRWPYVERAVRRALARSGFENSRTGKLLEAVRESYENPLPEITEDSLVGNMANTIAGRICNYFDLGAGGYTVDGACSPSLLSVAQACNALVHGEMDFALAGGVDISLDPFEIVGFAKAQALAREDIRPYDERAAGMLAGEGCGIFVLMRETDARASGRRIHALIRGWGISSDGTGGITAPEIEGQMRALRNAYDRAGYSISTVGLIEGHGTGTTLGDKVELTAILRLLQDAPGNGLCHIGSVKANIGHCKAAAGAAGVIKAVMALQRKVLPPTVNCARPNPIFAKSHARLQPSLGGQVWDAHDQPRRASVSSMGFGGANSHVTLEEANPRDVARPEDLALLGSQQSSEIILLSAPDVDQLRKKISALIPVATRICRAELTDLAADGKTGDGW